jgi:diguanylate cyclase (GGDEF)-like protein/PAS domain S-box-containing protein
MSAETAVGQPIHSVVRRGSRRISLFRVAAVLVVAYAVLDVLWLVRGWGGERATLIFSDLSAAGCAGMATLMCLYTWRVESPVRRRAWGILALAAASWTVGEVIWSFYEVVLEQEVPFPSYADAAYLLAYPLAAIAMLRLPTSPQQFSSRVRTVLDALIVGLSLLFVAWATFLGSLYRASEGTILEQTIGLAYPIADVVVASVAIFVVARARKGRRITILLIAAGLLALAVADSAFAYLTLSDDYATGLPIDAAWDIGYLLIALAAVRHDPSAPRPERTDERSAAVLFPYVPVAIAVVLGGIRKVEQGTIGALLFWGMIAIVLLVVIRQLLTLVDNLALTRNLEGKVRERTAALARSEERHRSLVHNSSDVVTILDREGVVVDVTEASTRVFGFEPSHLQSRHFVEVVHPEDRTTVEAYFKRFMAKPGDTPPLEWRIRHGDGSWHYCESVGTNLLEDPTVEGFVLNTRDISERKELELQLRHQAFHDQLTGSANRALFRDRADHALRRAARNRRPIAVLYCDLDNLKSVNDRLGHEVGDKLLTAVAERFGTCIREEDTVARLGGDEFAVLLTDGGNEAAAKHVAGRLLKALDEPFFIDNHVIRSSVSIGIAISWGRQEVDELLRNADLAMYEAKNRGKARFELFEPEQSGSSN